MKNLITIIALLISATSYAQIINDNTDVNTSGNQLKQGLFWDGTNWVNARAEGNIFSYPFKYFYENNFTSNITGTTAFNGGVIAFNSGALRVVGSSSARGVLIGGAKTDGVQYVAKDLYIEDQNYDVQFLYTTSAITYAITDNVENDQTLTIPTPSTIYASKEITINSIDTNSSFSQALSAGIDNIRNQGTDSTNLILLNNTV